jgi:23S rRNA pseudouridine2604 synthase
VRVETAVVRVSKLMADRAMCSRREADAYLAEGLVRVDGEIVGVGAKALPTAVIALEPRAQQQQAQLATILLNKPVGWVSAQPEDGYRPAIELLTPENQDPQFPGPRLQNKHFQGLAVAGRLDIDSRGLLVFTQDGRLARQLIGENSGIEKEYLVRVTGRIDDRAVNRLRHGIVLDDKPLKPAQIDVLGPDRLRFVLKEGKKRQIRRMCELVGLHVHSLVRVRVGRVRLGDLNPGQWRFLRPDEGF